MCGEPLGIMRIRFPHISGSSMHPFTVALTGGIASGKSAVARRFEALGASVVDADAIARELVQPGKPALEEIAAAFGPQILGADGALERAEMRSIVFGDAQARHKLEAILHPRVRAEMLVRTDAASGPYVLLVVPLFVETAGYGWVDRVLVVDLPRDVQLARAIARDNMPPSLAEAMIDAQASREQRLAAADDVIDNSGPPEALDAQVEALHRHYVDLAELRRADADPRS
jgi:dephospho-CoA kinase